MIRLGAFVLALSALSLTSPMMSHAADATALSGQVQTIDGSNVDLGQYKGKVLLVVNVASKCGYTPQYKSLQAVYSKYEKDGLVVLGFPCNQFGGQEPGTATEIKEFCSTKYNVTFPMFAKVDVNGDNASPFFKTLTATDTKPTGKGPVKWNFEKFLIGRDGQVIGRFGSGTKPDSEELTKAIEAALNAKS